jgi:DNA-binding NtrC family response regulator
MEGSILLIDDEEQLLKLFTRTLKLEGYEVTQAKNIAEAFKALEKNEFDMILTDVKLPDGDGVEATKTYKEKYPNTEIIVITAYGTIKDGVKAIQNGAFNYLTKGDDNERLLPLVANGIQKARLQQRLNRITDKAQTNYGFGSVIGESESLKKSITLARRVAPTPTTVLLTGETGTGKEVFAQAIHYESDRAKEAFVALNCSAFAPHLLESELFGYKAGAFTGANKDKKGLLEEGHRGTVFLDEIGEMPLELQAKILRFLETGEFIKVGDTKVTKIQTRIIAATNRELLKEAEENKFRLDLYYRLAVFQIHLPPLVERGRDIELLARFFIKHFSAKMGKKSPMIEQDFIEKLQTYSWKGNVRELKNVIERAIIMSDDLLTPDVLLFGQTNATNGAIITPLTSLAEVEKHHMKRVLAHTENNKSETAKILGIGLTTLYRKMQEYELEK